MRLFIALALYRLLLPLLFIAAFPGWIVKMLRRGGFGTALGERVAIYKTELEYEPCGEVHFHAVSVGESLLALKLMREWLEREPQRRFVLATGTATGHAVATAANLPELRVTYAPLDFPSMVRRYLNRFEPSQIVLVEGEVWPHLMFECETRKIPVNLVNARMSPRSARRFAKFASWLRPFYQTLGLVAIQEPEDAGIWQTLGIDRRKIHDTGSLKFDPGSGARPQHRSEFQTMIDAFGKSRPVVLAASTFQGEEVMIAGAIRAANPEALAVIVPRHAERRAEVKADLEGAGFPVVLRSSFHESMASGDCGQVFVIDSTGELRDWTAHADVVVVGKSFLSTGGQNPCEAILAERPLIFGPHMENFQPLVRRLIASGGCISADPAELAAAILTALDPVEAARMTRTATAALARHDGATRRILSLLMAENAPII
ncbi:MAG: glycosyltransferase N-terminal domain-containing protein [Luteolibacter sp.]|uniref:3-deoxy-D-manno-octulosonic acid transferase n=1 Tax=Luteolibacter sp. TaxID=1962973 RepID=UPI003264B291